MSAQSASTSPRQQPTEQRNPASTNLDALSTLEMVRLMNREDAKIPLAIAEALPQIAQTVDLAAAALGGGHRLFYMGAGTSGRLAILDAVELLPTFSVKPGVVVPLLAGGERAITRSVEGAEDSAEQGRADLAAHDFSRDDLLLAIAASGRTPYCIGGLHYAQELGATAVALACNPGSAMAQAATFAIEVVPGAEVLTGSTRLKAGTAQKLVLNMISTATMVKLGKVYSNLMVDVQPTNEKLHDRALRIVCEATGVERARANALLSQADGAVKLAVLMGLTDLNAEAAAQKLHNVRGHIHKAAASAKS